MYPKGLINNNTKFKLIVQKRKLIKNKLFTHEGSVICWKKMGADRKRGLENNIKAITLTFF